MPACSAGFWVAMTKKARARVGGAVYGHLALLHRLQQGGLHLGRCAIDLVGQQHLREHRALVEVESGGVALIDVDAEDVGRQQVAGELHPAVFQAQHPGQAMGQRGLAHAGHVLDQQMAAGDQAGQSQADGLRLPRIN